MTRGRTSPEFREARRRGSRPDRQQAFTYVVEAEASFVVLEGYLRLDPQSWCLSTRPNGPTRGHPPDRKNLMAECLIGDRSIGDGVAALRKWTAEQSPINYFINLQTAAAKAGLEADQT